MEIKNAGEMAARMNELVLDPALEEMRKRLAAAKESALFVVAMVATPEGGYISSAGKQLFSEHVDSARLTRDLLVVLADHMSKIPGTVVIGAGARSPGESS